MKYTSSDLLCINQNFGGGGQCSPENIPYYQQQRKEMNEWWHGFSGRSPDTKTLILHVLPHAVRRQDQAERLQSGPISVHRSRPALNVAFRPKLLPPAALSCQSFQPFSVIQSRLNRWKDEHSIKHQVTSDLKWQKLTFDRDLSHLPT